MTLQEERVVVLYHADCWDGVTAAWAVQRRHPDADLIPVRYGDDPPYDRLRDAHVVIVDFSYSVSELIAIDVASAEWELLDHHKTAMHLTDHPKCTIDQSKSGARLAWDRFGDGDRPWIIDYVEDRDLWLNQLDRTKEVNAALRVLPITVESVRWARWQGFEDVAARGAQVLYVFGAQVGAIAATARKTTMDFSGGGKELFADVVACCENRASMITSDLGHRLVDDADRDPLNTHNVAVIWHQRSDGKFEYQLRSDSSIDVSELAKQVGGGGHPTAAGFTSDYPLGYFEVSK